MGKTRKSENQRTGKPVKEKVSKVEVQSYAQLVTPAGYGGGNDGGYGGDDGGYSAQRFQMTKTYQK